MKVIILCGGMGTRMKESTEFKPKPMVYIGNKPLLWHIMKIYANYGFNEFILALGYKAEYIKDYFLNQKAFTTDFTLDTSDHKTEFHMENRNEVDKFKITFVDTDLETRVAERILQCEKYIPKNDEYFMFTYGDGIGNINIADLVKFHKQQGTIGTITGVHPTSRYGIIKLSEKDETKITGFQEKPTLIDWINGGFGVYKREFMEYLQPNEMEHPALKRIAAKGELSIFKHDGFWIGVDTQREVDQLNAIWKSGEIPWRVW